MNRAVESIAHDGVVIGPCTWISKTIDCTGAKGADPTYHAPLKAIVEDGWIKTQGTPKTGKSKSGG